MTEHMSDETKKNSHELVAEILGVVEWLNDVEGLCECPGRSLHTGHNGKRDCKIYLGGIPTLTCFHSSCKTVVEERNAALRRALRDGEAIDASRSKKVSAEEKKRIAEIQRKEGVRKRAANSRAAILKKYRWTYEEISNDSPVNVSEGVMNHAHQLLSHFKNEDVLWIGDKYDSGPEHADHFKTVEQWKAQSVIAGPLICAAVFKNTSTSRSNENVIARRFLVIESDTLSRDEVGAIFKWLRDEVRLRLVAIVDTAGKSLHGWFEYPPDHIVDELKLVLPELGCDPALFKASQPVRLPGASRDGKFQKLVYLAEVA